MALRGILTEEVTMEEATAGRRREKDLRAEIRTGRA